MAIYAVYATKADLSEYLGVAVPCLPEESERQLKRASELVKQVTFENIDVNNTNHMEAVKLATCAQVEFWSSAGEDASIVGGVQRYSLGSLSVDMAQDAKPFLCNRARQYLNQQCLLYRGVRQNFWGIGSGDL